jgi:hypothetical protein
MMDELRFQFGQQRREILDRHMVLRGLRIDRAERLGDEITGVLDECERRRRGPVHQHLAAVQTRASFFIRDVWVEQDGRQFGTCLSAVMGRPSSTDC